MDRPNKNTYYMNIAKSVSERSTCLRRQFGAVIVKNDEILSTGYNGAPRGLRNCNEIGTCKRQELNIPGGQRYELCRSVHAEANAIISASRQEMIGSTLYLSGYNVDKSKDTRTEIKAIPCEMCKRMIINAGIKYVVIHDVDHGILECISPDFWINEENDSLKNN